jgi:N-terminal domain of NWD NACHT-NTPase
VPSTPSYLRSLIVSNDPILPVAAMPERSSSFWRRLFSGKGRSATGQENSKKQNRPTVQSSVVSPSHVSATSKDATQTSTTTTDVSQPANQLEPLSSVRQAPATTSTSSLPLPVAQGAISSDVATSADVHRTATPPELLWDRAYDDLKIEETALLHAYEKILSYKLHENTFSSTVTKSPPNAIAQHDPDTRRRQMEQLVHTGLDKTAREANMKEGLDSTMDTVLSLRDTISFAIQAMPQAALAWTGVCTALEVSSSTI